MDASNTLRIRAAQVADSGRFSCIVSNSSGETSWSATLRVIGEILILLMGSDGSYNPVGYKVTTIDRFAVYTTGVEGQCWVGRKTL